MICSVNFFILVHWCRRRGCNCTPKSFNLVRIRAKSEEICAKYVQIFGKLLYVLWFCKNGTQKISLFFCNSCINWLFSGNWRKIWGSFGEVWANMLLKLSRFENNAPSEMQSFFMGGGHFLWILFRASLQKFGLKFFKPPKFACYYTYVSVTCALSMKQTSIANYLWVKQWECPQHFQNEDHLPTYVRFCCWDYPLQRNDFTFTVG